MSFIDISVPLSSSIPTWPGSPGFQLKWLQRMEDGDLSNNSKMIVDIHTGTHIDAPLHFLADGLPVADIEIDRLIGPGWVADLTSNNAITNQILEASGIPDGVKRLLLKTDNSQLWLRQGEDFNENYVGLTESGAQWIIENKIFLVGIDYLSIQRFHDGPEVHQKLLDKSIIILEGLNLVEVDEGFCELICLPLKIENAEGAPARAILSY